MKQWPRQFRQAGTAFLRDPTLQMGAALAFYALFSLAPLLLLFLETARWFYLRRQAGHALVDALVRLLGSEGSEPVARMITRLLESDPPATVPVVGSVILLVGATAVVVQFKYALDTIFESPAPEDTGGYLRRFVRRRLTALFILVLLAILWLVSLLGSWVLYEALRRYGNLLPGSPVLLTGLNILGVLVGFTLGIGLIFRWLPERTMRWSTIWVGAAVTAVLFTLGKETIGWYLAYARMGSVYGSAGSLIALMLWIYYTNLIILYGAEFTKVYEQRDALRERIVNPPDESG